MSSTQKKKLCWNCEGYVDRELENCPYCGVYLLDINAQENQAWNQSYFSENDNTSKLLSSLYPSMESSKEAPSKEEEVHLNKDSEPDLVEEHKSASSQHLLWDCLKKDVIPLVFLMTASFFFLFSLILFLFSHEGVFTLQWKGKYWIHFLVASIPLFVIGWKYFQDADFQE